MLPYFKNDGYVLQNENDRTKGRLQICAKDLFAARSPTPHPPTKNVL